MPAALRFGVIGSGTWARSVHIHAAASEPLVQLTGVLGRDADRTTAAVDGTSAQPFSQLEKFLDAVDIVGFAVPPAVQIRMARSVIEAGKHVLLEKPVAIDADDAADLAARARARSIRSLVFFTHRFVPELAKWTAEAKGEGPWAIGRVDSYSSLLAVAGDAVADSAWRHEHGSLWDVGPHAVARLCGVLGPVATAVARRGRGDCRTIVLQHDSGAIGIISLAADLRIAPPGGMQLVGSLGSAAPPAVTDWVTGARRAYRCALQRLAAEVTHGGPAHECNLEFGAHVTRVLSAAERSTQTDRVEVV
ncbi:MULTISPECIES: Gfo/Idh/MocA family protein [unclassified Microcella]|uniref:Gfo/Idh/MocA family protein n=1 Tax=unclassified Microcella TaxID=2630066 RepID=UPI0006FDD260|nr:MULTISPECIES: Gfo/Idh/MocA family oxidoreductase [unclassified Microcella]KQV26356.1 hypothetical protein ASC54_05530 [Yonghaparkia sp. Root332]KRF32858.1 hypothetical protein ASG83_02190 [Yonghaparkia sp. Soil809]